MAGQNSTSAKSKAAQEFVPVKEIRDGTVILKDGSLRAVLMASSLNFALKSEDEQMSILLQFQNFLNSLDFSVQFLIQSRDLDIRPYLALLEDIYKKQMNDLMKVQTREYIGFIKNFTENTSIMAKTFFIVVPYDQSIVSSKGGVSGMLGKKKTDTAAQNQSFEEARSQLEQRIAVVEQGLVRTGVRIVQLGSEELIELLYRTFNPGDLEKPIPMEAQKA